MSDDSVASRLEAILARLEALGLAAPAAAPFAAVNPDGTPGNVAAGELIESAWGNAVADTIAEVLRHRRTVVARTTPQTLGVGSYTTLVMPTTVENSGGLALGPPLTIPPDAAGPYTVTFRCTLSASGAQIGRLLHGATQFDVAFPGNGQCTITIARWLSGGDTIQAQVYTPIAANVTNAVLELLPFVRPTS